MSDFVEQVNDSKFFCNSNRLSNIKDEFFRVFGHDPIFYTRAPGRVNLIGEHIDYCGYGVLPMAINQDIICAVSINDNRLIRLHNTNAKYRSYENDTTKALYSIDKKNPEWFHYVICGYRGILENISSHCKYKKHSETEDLHDSTYSKNDHSLDQIAIGLNIVVDGTVPPGSGLSSSSALVCSSALATCFALDKAIKKIEMAEICQKSERYIGMEGGGMDQSISFLAQIGIAKLVDFNPIRTQDVFIPSSVVFVISNSLVEINKAATNQYNTRVAECRLAAQVIAKKEGLQWQLIKRLFDLQTVLNITLKDCISLVEKNLDKKGYDKSEIAEILEVSIEQLDGISLSERSKNALEYHLYKRSKHVFSEALRVLEFKQICDDVHDKHTSNNAGDASHSEAEVLLKLGQLMNDSHISCRDLYECSCEELDNIVQHALSSEAIGSRLTGAGWGGCAVSLLPCEKVESFLIAMKKQYEDKGIHSSLIANSLFVTKPGDGAKVYKP